MSARPLLHWLASLPRSNRGIIALLVVTTALVLILSQVLQDQMASHLVENLLANQKLRLQEKVRHFDATLSNAETSVRRYASLLSDPRHSSTPPASEFEATFRRHPDGSWRLPRERFDPRQDANAWIPPSVPLTEANRRFFLRALEITRSFGQGALQEPLVNSWMLPLINGMTAYWPTKPDYLYDASSTLSYLKTPWVTLTDPRVNPRHEPRWVGPEFDPAAKDWSISVVAPFFRDGIWAGSVGHDMVVSRLVANLIDRRDAGANSVSRPLFVARTNGELLAKPGGIPTRGERAPTRYLSLLSRRYSGRELEVIHEGGNVLVMASIPTLQAKVAYEVDGTWLRSTVGKELTGLQLGQGLFVLLAVGSVCGLAVKDAQARRQQQVLLESRNRDLNALAKRDHLTGLPNRTGFIEEANHAILRARHSGSDLLVAFVDLDRFKLINDSMGHDSGDALLKAVAQRLLSGVRSSDTVARLGGDEFVLILEDLEDQFDAAHLVEQLHACFAEPLMIETQPQLITPSIGVSVFPEDGEDIATLMRQADMAMYEVKTSGRNGWLFYSEQMNQAVQERLQLERDLRRGLEDGQLHLHYQPQWTMDGLTIKGWEALLRWSHPERGPIRPDVFIPVAEEMGLINQMGLFVLDTACRQAVSWQVQGLGRFGMSVNLSVKQLDHSALADNVEACIADTGLDPELLELEITETFMLQHPDRMRQLLNRFRDRGIRVAIDDFGTGYSSLSYIGSLPIDRLKIDRTFVASCLTDGTGAAIIEAVISLARSLEMETIAEGVETEAQRRFLRLQGCQQCQGYLLGRPMPAEAIPDYLQSLGL